MTLQAYLAFLTVAVVVAVVPGPDVAVVSSNTLTGGRRRGWATAVGVAGACAVQGVAAAAGLGAFILRSQPVFQAIKWAGVAYLAYLAGLALTHAVVAMLWLALLVTLMDRASGWLSRRRVRRWLDAITGTMLGGFSVALAIERS